MYVRQYTTFETFHPVLLLFYALGAPILSMLTSDPLYLGITIVCAFCIHWFYYGIGETAKAYAQMIPILLVIAAFNMLTNHRGMTLLFQIGHTPFTLESLCYGLANGTMLLAVLIWFRCFSAVLSNEKFLYLFGKRLPATALLLSMILKLFPETKHKISSIQVAQGPIENGKQTGLKGKINNSMRQISSLLEWSMEDSIDTADSMKARGYGESRRTSYERYLLTVSDGVLLLLFIIVIGVTGYALLRPNAVYQYFPVMRMLQSGYSGADLCLGVVSSICYMIFLLTPVWLELNVKRGGKHTWKI